jgi:lipopolysaccharide/colanic/teichoic acid biosynthesis glycosyltransferase
MLKRGFDVVASGVGLVVLSPLFFVITIAVRLNSRGPVFYRARRVGRHGKEFLLYKFRSMITDADQIGPGITSAQDNRITSVGRFLRRTKLDELPQLINVVRGEMSLVGPRPEDPRYVELYTPEQREVLMYPALQAWLLSHTETRNNCCRAMIGSACTLIRLCPPNSP